MRISTFQGWWQDGHGDHDGHTWIWTQPYVIKTKVFARVHVLVTKTLSGCGYIIG
jgi:hypothetical protein